ncbi:hypothetical protein [Flavitalea sp.]|nr:hypothetical protein [Flavitalea sp.]
MRQVIFFVCFLCCLQAGLGQNLKISYSSPYGISAMSYGNNTLIDFNKQLGRPFGPEVFKLITKDKKVVSEWSQIYGQSWDDKKKEYSVALKWGTASVRYLQVGDTLNVTITLTNKTDYDTLCGMSFCPLTLNVGKRPLNFQPSFPYYSNNINSPAAISAQLGTFDIVVENPERNKKVYMGWLEENNTNGALYRIWHGNIPFNGMTDFNPEVELRLPPGKSFTYTMAIKFVKPNLSLNTVASKAFQNYRVNQPSTLTWKDRRPIAELFLGSYGPKKQRNPRNWVMYNSDEVDIITKNGNQQFRLNALKYARNSLRYLKNINSQGVIVWDIEGQEFPHPLTYIGSPELISKLAPEMNEVADEFFAVFKKEGYKTGICIRPDSVVFKGNWIDHVPVSNPAITLINKINYARKRWGCTIFYVDSNVDPLSRLMNAEVFRAVHEAIPDVLLIPEHENIQYFNYSAPYTDLKAEQSLLVDKAIKDVNPAAFKVITISEGLRGTPAQNLKQLTQSVEEGNILLFRGWYPDEPTHSLIKKAWETGSKNRK